MNLRRIRNQSLIITLLYGLTGVIVSILAHELFHILVHLDGIENIAIFPDSHTIAAVTATVESGYDINIEELMAYSITLLILIITIFDVTVIHDSRNEKSSIEVLFPKDHDFDRSSFHEIAVRTKLI